MKRAVYALVAALVVALVVIVALMLRPERRERAPALPAATPAAVSAPAGAVSFPDVYERVSPAVVSIVAEAARRAPTLSDLTLGGPPVAPPESAMSAGSGFFIAPEGYVVTNNHVIGDAGRVAVILRDGAVLPARLIGRDGPTDLAVLKVEGRDFPYVSFSGAAPPRVGEEVIAIGNPFGLGTTATTGIISAQGRDIGSAYVNFLQLDAAINQGNSGGPTFNSRGEVVGVNTAIFSPTGGSVGIGFAIPAATAAEVSRQLIQNGRVERGFIGATIGDLPPATGRTSGAALVAGVLAGGPAARGGLRPGDVITAVDGQGVTGAADVIRRVTAAAPGKPLRFSVVRDGRRTELSVTPQRR